MNTPTSNPLDNLFCPETREFIVQHFQTCETCRASILTALDQFPLIKMLVPKDLLERLTHGRI